MNWAVITLLPFIGDSLKGSPIEPFVTVYPAPLANKELLICQPKLYTLLQVLLAAMDNPPFEVLVNVMD